MSNDANTQGGSDARRDLAEWARERPLWQQEALRRLVVQKDVSSVDVDEITELCRLSKGLPPKLATKPRGRPIDQEQLGGTAVAGGGAVFLRGLRDLEGVSALADGASLKFVEDHLGAGPCLVVVYGRNASGKSSYARILKACGRSRAAFNPLPPNYLGPSTSTTVSPSAVIDFSVAESTCESEWVQGNAADPRLQAVAFFDAECADVQVRRPNTLSYMPGELQLLKRLGEVCRSVQEKLREEKDSLVAVRAKAITSAKLVDGSEARRAVDAVKNADDLQDLEILATLSEDENGRLRELEADFLDVESARRRANAACNRLTTLHDWIEELASATSPDEAARLKESLTKRDAAEEVLQSLVSDETADIPLPGFGTPAWRLLWDAARGYSEEHAYPEDDFPVTWHGARCVLCQQDLSETARDRFLGFARFFREEAEQLLASTERELRERFDYLVRLDERRRFGTIDSMIADIEQSAPDLVADVRDFWSSAIRRLELLASVHTAVKWPELPQLPSSPAQRIKGVAEGLQKKEEDLGDERVREELRQELTELEAREALRDILPDIEKDLQFRTRLSSLDDCEREAATEPITRLSTDLARTLITERLLEDFGDELQRLRLTTAEVELATHGSYGAPQFQVRLAGLSDSSAVPAVLSEGEKRCVALAGFFAECRRDASVSALVFDDPVTSLDHNWRDAVASRLVQEAHQRQVIVFTHDIVFLFQLQELAKKGDVPFHPIQVERLGRKVGTYKKGKPWIARSVRERLKLLKNTTLREATDLYDVEGSETDYDEKVGYFYARLRETWERAVEECLFQESVVRFRRSIETRRLAALRNITGDDLKVIDEAMTHCSLHMIGHDAVPQENLPIPPPDALRADWESLDSWVKEHETRPKLRS